MVFNPFRKKKRTATDDIIDGGAAPAVVAETPAAVPDPVQAAAAATTAATTATDDLLTPPPPPLDQPGALSAQAEGVQPPPDPEIPPVVTAGGPPDVPPVVTTPETPAPPAEIGDYIPYDFGVFNRDGTDVRGDDQPGYVWFGGTEQWQNVEGASFDVNYTNIGSMVSFPSAWQGTIPVRHGAGAVWSPMEHVEGLLDTLAYLPPAALEGMVLDEWNAQNKRLIDAFNSIFGRTAPLGPNDVTNRVAEFQQVVDDVHRIQKALIGPQAVVEPGDGEEERPPGPGLDSDRKTALHDRFKAALDSGFVETGDLPAFADLIQELDDAMTQPVWDASLMVDINRQIDEMLADPNAEVADDTEDTAETGDDDGDDTGEDGDEELGLGGLGEKEKTAFNNHFQQAIGAGRLTLDDSSEFQTLLDDLDAVLKDPTSTAIEKASAAKAIRDFLGISGGDGDTGDTGDEGDDDDPIPSLIDLLNDLPNLFDDNGIVDTDVLDKFIESWLTSNFNLTDEQMATLRRQGGEATQRALSTLSARGMGRSSEVIRAAVLGEHETTRSIAEAQDRKFAQGTAAQLQAANLYLQKRGQDIGAYFQQMVINVDIAVASANYDLAFRQFKLDEIKNDQDVAFRQAAQDLAEQMQIWQQDFSQTQFDAYQQELERQFGLATSEFELKRFIQTGELDLSVFVAEENLHLQEMRDANAYLLEASDQDLRRDLGMGALELQEAMFEGKMSMDNAILLFQKWAKMQDINLSWAEIEVQLAAIEAEGDSSWFSFVSNLAVTAVKFLPLAFGAPPIP